MTQEGLVVGDGDPGDQLTMSASAPSHKTPRLCDYPPYKGRNQIERRFDEFKQFRCVATRYDKLLANFMGCVKRAAIAVSLG